MPLNMVLNNLIRRVAYTALKEGVESGQESNEKLEEDLIARYRDRLRLTELFLITSLSFCVVF